MAKKSATPKVENPTPEAEPTNAHGNKQPASKSDAIRMAIAAGFDSPQAGSSYIKSQFGMDVTPQHFSATKAQFKNREGAKKEKPGRKAKVDGYLAPPESKKQIGEQADLLAGLETLKTLITQHGADKVKKMVELLG